MLASSCPGKLQQEVDWSSVVQIFERPDPANAALTSAELAVKRFARTVSIALQMALKQCAMDGSRVQRKMKNAMVFLLLIISELPP